jgi:serine/threonine protein phosphatase PrpC
MVVTCPACGGTSHDLEFCDHCNADLAPPAASEVPRVCPLRPEHELSPEHLTALARPDCSIIVQAPDRTWRVHWLPSAAWDVWRPFVEERQRYTLPALPPCRVIAERTGVWVAAETSAKPFDPWVDFHYHDAITELRRLIHALDLLARALDELHQHDLVWLTFDPREIEQAFAVAPAGNGTAGAGGGTLYFRFTNLDLQVHPARQCPQQLPVPPLFAAPEVARFQAGDVGPGTNVFHLALYAYYWLARLLPRGFAGRGLEAFGFTLAPLRTFVPAVPPGLSAVLERGLAVDPKHRFATPAEFVEAFGQAVARAEKRWSATDDVHWQIGAHSRTGRTKAALGKGNEDLAVVRTFDDPQRALVAVADGITTCHVGSGTLASWMASVVLEQTFDPTSTQEGFPRLIRKATRTASEMILSWALEKGYRNQLLEGRDLMGTTLCAGWLQGNRLIVANLGDSRAYLIDDHIVEQLTVDGDLGSELLATGTPPEEVRELGGLSRALRVCVGGCAKNDAGELAILEEFCRPVISYWPLLPGDTIVLCSDGLVEEGAFLEPPRLAELVRQHRDLSAADLALLLAEQADALHRLPSQLEPEGFGDNITCIVIRIS